MRIQHFLRMNQLLQLRIPIQECLINQYSNQIPEKLNVEEWNEPCFVSNEVNAGRAHQSIVKSNTR